MIEQTNLLTLSRTQCLRYMAESDIGRVVFVLNAMPAIQPVNFLLLGHEVFYRTANGAKLAIATRNTIVAFQVDQIDHQTQTGWSAVGVGPCREVTDPAELARLGNRLPEPWVGDHTCHTIAINLARISGRLITLAGGVTSDFYIA